MTNPERFSDEVIERSILRPNNDIPIDRELQDINVGDKEVYFTLLGNSTQTLDGTPVLFQDGEKAYAKRVHYPELNKTLYYVKANNYSLYNPIGLDLGISRIKMGNEPALKWMKVSPLVFKYYLRFLTTRNQAHFRHAERELR